MAASTRVLIVDDRVAVRMTLRHILRGFSCSFSEAADADSALEHITTKEFDVSFLDLKLPDLPGLQMLREARRLGATLGRVIILTGAPEPATEAEASELGAFRYLTKPISRTEVRRAFAEAISCAEPPSFPPTEMLAVDREVGRALGSRGRVASAARARLVSRPRVLVLDDKPAWLDTMDQVLGDAFHLTLTMSPEEACRRTRKEHFALVVLDMRLVGGVSGLDVLSRMRRSSPDLRAIILTAHPDYRSAFESGRRGALAYVSKGELASLLETVERIVHTETRPVRIFLCYDRRDRAQISHLYGRLMRRGFLPWMDVKSIVAGRKWEPQIRKAIEKSDYFVFCLSTNSQFKEGMIRKELKQALERLDGLREDSIFFITARLEDIEVDEPFNKFQYVDLFRRDGFRNLLQAFFSHGKTAQ